MKDEVKRQRNAERAKRLMPYLLAISGIMLAAIPLSSDEELAAKR